MKRFSFLVILGIMLSGCSSSSVTSETEVKPVPFSDQNSFALNIANQSYLRQPFTWGLETYQSPLKDFTEEEIESLKTSLKNQRGNGAYLASIIALTTGNLMASAIHFSGGSLEKLVTSDHIASRAGWVISVDAAPYKDGIEANMAANKLIEDAVLETLREKGNVLSKVVLEEERTATFGGKIYGRTSYVIGEDKTVSFGLVSDDYENLNGMKFGKTNLIDAESQYVTAWNTPAMGPGSLYLFYDNKIKGYSGVEGYEQYLKDVTAKLPKGFYFYLPSFPHTGYQTVQNPEDWKCATCVKTFSYRMTNVVVPAIYTQGKKYEFIKP
ncbi:hypothetical protein BOO91_12630 [Vibrio navarrensis]|uniref:Lipoprotein n=1 Tax=Vibrio navarrensis TaxID=29495 RepID=A0AAJ4LTF2_9VIBR|nr:hypothetical protein [Vibrio navarrensis]MBE3661775.1 hypothetical protein [Vibrio navarrensis]QPL52449.1 hypothetical protein I3X05_10505 [Vibrio navarrensis]